MSCLNNCVIYIGVLPLRIVAQIVWAYYSSSVQ
jgi:hypothetical protein